MAGPQVDSSLTKQNYETEVFQHQVKNKITPTMRLPLELHTRTVGLPNYIEKTLMDIYGPVATVDKTRVPAGVVYRRPDVPLVTFEQLKQYPADFNPDVLIIHLQRISRVPLIRMLRVEQYVDQN